MQRLATSSGVGERKIELLASSSAGHQLWRPLRSEESPLGYASFYYADDLAALPVRAITRVKDNKSDPNLETGTYGLFSTCQERMRAGIVQHGATHVFFFARPRGNERHLTGMYELAAWTPGALGADAGDFALAAKAIRFIAPIPVSDLPVDLARALGTRWRLNKQLTPAQTAELAALVEAKPDITYEYLRETDRLERLNKYYSGFRYPTWQREEPWSWADASSYLRPGETTEGGTRINNASPTGWWGCNGCNAAIENAALLKACPRCRQLGTLRPLASSEVDRIEKE